MGSHRFHLRKIALLVASCYLPVTLAAQAARIEFATPEPIIVGADGRERPARKGEALLAGDRVLTRTGRVQLAFLDGAYVSLQPNTDFGVAQYSFSGKNDGNEKGVFSLVKGALRTVTGLIGRSRRDAYVMQTPSATIGIRGTGGRIEVNEQGTFVAGTSGTWFITTSGGTIDIPAGSNGFAGPNRNDPPKLTASQPETPPAAPALTGFAVADQVGSGGGSALFPQMVDGGGYKVLHVSWDGTLATVDPTTATFLSGVGLDTFIDGASLLVSKNTASLIDVGNDGVIGWGRWTNGTYLTGANSNPLNGNQGLHYVVGIPTASMPTTGSASYSLVGATSPTELNGVYAPGKFALNSMTVNFGSSTFSLGFAININSNTYTASAAGGLSGNGFSWSGGVSCYTTCSGNVNGTFFGVSAERLGIQYKIHDTMLGKDFVGTAALKAP
jgi:hypothetical protein